MNAVCNFESAAQRDARREASARDWEKALRLEPGAMKRVRDPVRFALQQMWDGAGAGDPAPYVVLEPEPKEM